MEINYGVADSHVHLWDIDKVMVPWVKNSPHAPLLGPKEYTKACGKVKVDKIVFMECAAPMEDTLREVALISEMAKEEPRICAIIARAPLAEGKEAARVLDELVKFPLVKGIRTFSRDPENPKFIEGLKLLPQYNLSFAIGGHYTINKQTIHMLEMVGDLNQYVFDHMGKPPVQFPELFDEWAKEIEILAQCKNLSCKLSSLATEAKDASWDNALIKPYVDTCIKAFGPDRLMYGSDFPVSTVNSNIERQWDTLMEFTKDFTEEEMYKLLRGNTERIYNI
ncbi:MAG: amidohydrolase family protein [Christensenellaceae bacterium]|nr:amidohydrolase family protein [Christensenellaceae bacterium]